MATSPSISTPQPPIPESISPESIDTLPVLSALLSRLQNPASTTAGSSAGSPPATSPSQLSSGTGGLTIKDIPTATDHLKHKIQRARVQIKSLPDLDRTITEQEMEMRELENKIRKQREVLEGLKEVGIIAKRDREQRERAAGADVMET